MRDQTHIPHELFGHDGRLGGLVDGDTFMYRCSVSLKLVKLASKVTK
jgi:hypothetical protein